MKKLYNIVSKLYDTEVPAQGLALFRILYGIVFLMEVLQLNYFQHLIFDPIPYIAESEISFKFALIFWLITIICFILGLFTRISSIINYVLTFTIIAGLDKFEYHLDYAMTGINFLLMFVPTGRAFSLDNLLAKLKYSIPQKIYEPKTTTSMLSYYSLVGLGIAMVYFDSMFYKLASPMWLKGLGFWWPTSLPFATYLDLSILLNSKIISYGFGFVTLVFEGVFLFYVWNKKYRNILVLTGIGLHLGILHAYPIPWFALAAAGLYVLLLPYEWWTILHNKLRSKTPTLTIFYNSDSLVDVRCMLIIKHLDFFGKIAYLPLSEAKATLKEVPEEALIADVHSINSSGKVFVGLATYIEAWSRIWFLWPFSILMRLPLFNTLAKNCYQSIASNKFEFVPATNMGITPISYDSVSILKDFTVKDFKVRIIAFFTIYCIVSQGYIIMYKGLLVTNILEAIHVNGIVRGALSKFHGFAVFNQKVFGITSHPVFMDKVHFNGYNHIVAIVYKDKNGQETWLPLNNEKGQVGPYITGREWVEWSFRSNSKNVSQEKLKDGLIRYSAFWASKHHVSLAEKQTFVVKVKKIDSPTGWEDDFLHRQMAKPWMDVGQVIWENKEVQVSIPEIEKL